MDWFKGKIRGKPHDFHGKIYGFRLRFSQQKQSIHYILYTVDYHVDRS